MKTNWYYKFLIKYAEQIREFKIFQILFGEYGYGLYVLIILILILLLL